MIRYGLDFGGETYFYNVVDDDTGELILEGDGWESPGKIVEWFSQLKKALGDPIKIRSYLLHFDE